MPTVSNLVDKNGVRLESGDSVVFHSYRGTPMKAVVGDGKLLGVMTEVVIGQDPFPTMVDHRQLAATSATRRKNKMPRSAPASAPTAKELRRQAKALRIEGWEEMGRDDLAAAISEHEGDSDGEARRTRPRKATGTAKKAAGSTRKSTGTARKSTRTRNTTTTAPPAKKVRKGTAKKATKSTAKRTSAPRPPRDPESPNPYRPGTNRWHFVESLLRGGKRSTQVARLRTKVKFAPRQQSAEDFDTDLEIDKRLKVVSYDLCKDNGFTRVLTGRGSDSTLQVYPPGVDAPESDEDEDE